MPKTVTSINSELYDFLKTKNFNPVAIKDGKPSVYPEEAFGFNFDFVSDQNDYGTMHIAVDSLKNLILFYSKEAMKNVNSEWTEFLKELGRWGMKKGLGFKLDPIDNLKDYIRKKAYNEKINEGYYGTKTTSYSDKTPETVKIVIVHNKKLDENDKRFRYIKNIYVENSNKERFLLPTKKPSEAYAYARLIHDGGNPYDERGKHIAQISEDIKNLSSFVRATKNKQFNEDINSIVENALQKYQDLKSTMHKLTTKRGFNEYFENWKPIINEKDETNINEFSSMFQTNHIDPRIETSLPTLSKYGLLNTQMNEVMAFEEWANNLIDESLHPSTHGQIKDFVDLLNKDDDELALGPDAENIIGQIENLIQDKSLYDRLKKASKYNPDSSAKSIIIGWLEEHGHDQHHREILDQLKKDEPKSNDNNDNDNDASNPSQNNQSNVMKPQSKKVNTAVDDKSVSNQVDQIAATLKEDSIIDFLKLSGIQK